MSPGSTMIQVTIETRDRLRALGRLRTPTLPMNKMCEILVLQAWHQETAPELADALDALIQHRSAATLRAAKAAVARTKMMG